MQLLYPGRLFFKEAKADLRLKTKDGLGLRRIAAGQQGGSGANWKCRCVQSPDNFLIKESRQLASGDLRAELNAKNVKRQGDKRRETGVCCVYMRLRWWK